MFIIAHVTTLDIDIEASNAIIFGVSTGVQTFSTLVC